MESGLVPAAEWRELSDDEQRAIIRAGRTEIEDLPDEMRALVEEMVADAKSLSSAPSGPASLARQALQVSRPSPGQQDPGLFR